MLGKCAVTSQLPSANFFLKEINQGWDIIWTLPLLKEIILLWITRIFLSASKFQPYKKY